MNASRLASTSAARSHQVADCARLATQACPLPIASTIRPLILPGFVGNRKGRNSASCCLEHVSALCEESWWRKISDS